jgi:hypothetical protein
MNIRFSAYRSGVRNPTFSLSGPGVRWRTPYPTRRKALRVYHEDGLAAAQKVWNDALRTDYATPGRLRTAALNTRASFNRYVSWDTADGRPFADRDVGSDVQLGTNVLLVTVDVVVLDRRGVSGRILLWDLCGSTNEQSGLLAAPACLALEQIYGGGRAPSVEIWDLRGNRRWVVSRSVAATWERAATASLDRIAQS